MMSQSSNPSRQFDENSSSFIFESVADDIDKLLVRNKPSRDPPSPSVKDFYFKSHYLPRWFEDFAEEIRSFEVRKDDIWVLSFPKSGTMLLCNIISQLKQGIDFTSKNVLNPRNEHSFDRIFVPLSGTQVQFFEKKKEIEASQSPRIIRSHLPAQFLPVQLWTVRPKVIYIARNPKDTAVSFYHMMLNLHNDDLNIKMLSKDEHFDEFLTNVHFGPFDEHVLNYWQLRHLDNVLFLTYEELVADRFQGVKKISEFLECEYNDDDLKRLADYVSFQNMKKMNEEVSHDTERKTRFFRRGEVGGFVDEMTEEQIQKFDKWIVERFHDSGLEFSI